MGFVVPIHLIGRVWVNIHYSKNSHILSEHTSPLCERVLNSLLKSILIMALFGSKALKINPPLLGALGQIQTYWRAKRRGKSLALHLPISPCKVG